MASNSSLDLFYDAVLTLTKSAGQIIREKNLERNKYVEFKKSPKDLVTETDKQVERYLIDGIAGKFPDHKFIGEESSKEIVLTDAPTWVIDPIDGTMNFVHSFPHSCISIALYVNKQPVIGIVYNPMLEQLFTARKGQGAYLNGQPIKVSQVKTLSTALLMLENWGPSPNYQLTPEVQEHLKSLSDDSHSSRCLGSAALDLCMVACGAAEAYYSYGLQVWDIAAGELIVTEAGGMVTDVNGGPLDRLAKRMLATNNKEINDALAERLVALEEKMKKKGDL
ncbi:unnamed protein product [Phyllotreta striolata]|uniref:Inositol-1-monophosphatase n=1 Tax=Phyllotreta striolata TaxID=444603 RepID=A0A9P0GTG3_PHYSR|nr:unnamed protein product [Phyllotreta striolata]